MSAKAAAEALPPLSLTWSATVDGQVILRLVRLLLASVQAAGPDGLLVTRDSALISLAERLVGEAGDPSGFTRSTAMVLRDLVWRVDMAKDVLATRLTPEVVRELNELLDTRDVHDFIGADRPAAAES
ncbi:hypothetical protein [Oryzibacter oryziterrae]|uniref:hypothetical protein n=1 Tax=Oryzibacter oryziterrae TaxID=2766474 RepID=UPI001F1D2D7F|nr:hypothetical protein [Oryzibacter oryziterrae]